MPRKKISPWPDTTGWISTAQAADIAGVHYERMTGWMRKFNEQHLYQIEYKYGAVDPLSLSAALETLRQERELVAEDRGQL